VKGAEHGDVGADPDREHRDCRRRETGSFPEAFDREADIPLYRVGRLSKNEKNLPQARHWIHKTPQHLDELFAERVDVGQRNRDANEISMVVL
jgi:hypothetical protein